MVSGLTSFVDEANICAEIPYKDAHYSVNSTADVQDIRAYFERPRMFAFGSVTASAGTLNAGTIVPRSVIINTFSSAAGRLTGVHGIRAKVKLHLQVSATPFHQGILSLSFQYGVDDDGSSNERRGLYYQLCTHLPHVRLDMSEATSVELEIPYVWCYDFWELDNTEPGVQAYGHWAINKLTNPRVVAGQTAATYRLYMSLHDVELIGSEPNVRTLVVPQSGVQREQQQMGVASGLAMAGANLARAASKVPGLRAFGGAADWFLRASSGALSAFGFSKPVDERPRQVVVHYGYAGDSQIDLPNPSYVLGPFQSNKLAITPALGCNDEDEMALSYVLSKPSYIYTGTFSTTNDIGSLLYVSHVCPTHFWYRTGGTTTGNVPMPVQSTLTTNVFLPSTLCYLATHFRYWRGGFKFRVTFSKSKLHGGRVMFGFAPEYARAANNTPLSVGAPTTEVAGGLPQPSSYTTIFDLRDGNSFDFVVPYDCVCPYVGIYDSIGGVNMTVLEPLITSSVMASTVDFMVEVMAADDFEFACVAPSMMTPVGKGTVAIQAQSGVAGVSTTTDASQHVMGEQIKSLKQLAMVPTWHTRDVVNATLTEIPLPPFWKRNPFNMAVPMGNTVTRVWAFSHSSAVASMYAYVNGSTSYTMIRDGGTSQGVTLVASTYANDSNSNPTGFSNLYNRGNNALEAINIPENGTEVRVTVPSYSRFMRIPRLDAENTLGTAQNVLGDPIVSNGFYLKNIANIRVRNSSGATRRLTISRAAADDARCACYIGPPPVIVWPSTSTVSPVGDRGPPGFEF
uniref:Picornavirus capsid domain-containing protein n=1 Tax=Ginkgo biloba dicistrovirus TaxID=2739249 RepID=A0A7G9INL7_9VIRU|nr:hypothetical protein [Ginkgo biloba dicistrovirus]